MLSSHRPCPVLVPTFYIPTGSPELEQVFWTVMDQFSPDTEPGIRRLSVP